MIHTFNKKRILFFPVSWANSVARWILGVCSPSNTIRIKNDAEPGRDRSVTLDVNVPEVIRAAQRELDQKYVSRQELKDLLASLCDGQSIIMRNGVIAVNKEWLNANP